MVGCSPAALEGQTLRASVARLKGRKREDSLVVVSAYLRPVGSANSGGLATDLAALSQDILRQQSQQRWYAETSTHALVAKVQKQTRHHQSHNSEVTKDAQGASLVETLSECSLFNRTGPDPEYTCHRTQGMSVVDYMLAPLGS
jgi:hypothetical protein